ncbi:MAG TPA: isoaspartyl peptidase/L-asparaginase [Opitutaceae bacterium]|nr:isoaspartyl peptidase/L-asparaginase [Opitutaceae bacterium]
MKPTLLLALAGLSLVLTTFAQTTENATANKRYGIVIHGGAGTILRKSMTPELDAAYRAALKESLDAGYAILDSGGSSEEAVIAAIRLMEDNPLFNAGKGAVLNADGVCELDAAIMNGNTLAAGAITGIKHIKNPILLARAVKDKSPHVMLSGEGAEKFAVQMGFELVPNEYFQTDRRKEQLKKAKEAEQVQLHASKTPAGLMFPKVDINNDFKYGTVGAVALDKSGNLSAGTSTGGLTNKKFGRIGDSPIIGAGTYANNATCGISCTGTGEFFIRVGVAHDISSRMEYKGESVATAALTVLDKVAKLKGDGGLIAMDHNGNVTMPFNTDGMYRGYRLSDKSQSIQIYRDEK